MKDFYKKSTKRFAVEININDTAPDLTDGDSVILFFKGKDSIEAANYTTDGKAEFQLSPSETDLVAGWWYYEIWWYPGDGRQYPLDKNTVQVLDTFVHD